MKRKIGEIVKEGKDITFDYESLMESCDDIYDILNDISVCYKPDEKITTTRSNTESNEELDRRRIKKMKISDNNTYI